MSKRNSSEETARKDETDQKHLRTVEQLYENAYETCSLYIEIINMQERELEQQKEITSQIKQALARKELQIEHYQETIAIISEKLTQPNNKQIIRIKADFLSFWRQILPRTTKNRKPLKKKY